MLTAKRNRLGSAVASSTMLLKENKHVMKAYFEFIKKRAKELKLGFQPYLPVTLDVENKEAVDISGDLFLLSF